MARILKKTAFAIIFIFITSNAFSLSFTAGTEINNVFFTSERLTLASDGAVIIESQPFQIPILFGIGFSVRFIQKDFKRDVYYFSQNYDDFYFNKGFSFYSGYSFTFPFNSFFIQTQPALFYKYSTNEFFKQVLSLSGKQRLVIEKIHQFGIYLPVLLGFQLRQFSSGLQQFIYLFIILLMIIIMLTKEITFQMHLIQVLSIIPLDILLDF